MQVQARHQAITVGMISCKEREVVRGQTLRSLSEAGWTEPVLVECDRELAARRQERQERTAHSLLERAVANGREFVLFLEDDLVFNRHFAHNLTHWFPLSGHRAGGPFFASLYNPNVRELARRNGEACFVAFPDAVYGSQAFLLSLTTARYALAHWAEIPGMQDIKLSRLAARLGPIYYHVPSLVQHVGAASVWGGVFHQARDFDPDWRALPAQPV